MKQTSSGLERNVGLVQRGDRAAGRGCSQPPHYTDRKSNDHGPRDVG